MNNILIKTCQDIVENVTDGVRILDNHGNIIYANDTFCNLLGYNKQNLIGKSIYDLYPSEKKPLIEKRLMECKTNKRSCHKIEYQAPNGKIYFLKILSIPVFDKLKIFQGSYAIIFDITEQKKLEDELVKEKDFLNDLIALCPDSIIGINKKGTIIIFNNASEQLLGYNSKDVVNKMSISQIYGTIENARLIKKKLYSADLGGKGQLKGFETKIFDMHKNKIPIRLSATILYDINENEIGSVGFFHDLTLQKQMENRLRELSITDSLSGLFNQRHFYNVLSKEIERHKRYGQTLSIICFDLDNFKQCNDKMGHLEGDNIIRMVGEILKDVLRSTDFAFRYGGDEFMVILPSTELNGAQFSANRIRKTFNTRWSFNSMFKTEDLVPVTLSLGVAQIAANEMADTFIKRVDLAMYEAKRNGGDMVVEAQMTIGKEKNTEIPTQNI